MKKLISTLMLIAYMVTTFTVTVSAEQTDAAADYLAETLFSEALYNCDTTGIGATDFTEEVDNTVDASGSEGSSIKLSGEGMFDSNLFTATVDRNLTGKKLKLSFKLKMSEEAASQDWLSEKTINISYKIQKSGSEGDEQTQVAVNESGANVIVSTEWQEFNATFDIPADSECTGIKFYANPVDIFFGVYGGTTAWIDQISLKVIPNADELLSSVESIVATEDADGMNTGAEVLLDTAYIDETGIASMVATLEGTAMDSSDYEAEVVPAEDGKKKIVIEFNNLTYIKDFAVSGIKDIWGRSVDTQNATLAIDRDETTIISADGISGTDGKYAGITLVYDTDFINSDSLSAITVKVDDVALAPADYTASVNAAEKKISVEFDEEKALEKVIVTGIKDIWGRDVDCTKAMVKIISKRTYTKNLLGEEFTDFETNAILGPSGYTKEVDTTEKFSGTGSIKFTGACGYSNPIVDKFFPMTAAEAPQKVKISCYVKASDDIVLEQGGTHPYGAAAEANGDPTFARMRVHLKGEYRLPNGSTERYTLDWPGINIKGDYADWQYASCIITPDYTKHVNGVVPQGAELIGLGVNFAFDNGRNLTTIAQGAIWVDEVKATLIPADDEYLSTFKEVTPVNGETAAGSDKVTFKFNGPIEGGLMQDFFTIKENGTVADLDASLKTSYDADTDITTLTVTPASGFKNNTNYEVELTEVYDMWGRLVKGTHKVSFKVNSEIVAEAVEGGSVILNTEGVVTGAKAKVYNNNAAESKTAVLVVAVCNGTDIKAFKISDSANIAANGNATLTATLDSSYTLGAGDTVRAFVWDSTAGHRPLIDIIQ